MNAPRLRTIETGGRLLALCGAHSIRDMSAHRFVREAARAGISSADCQEAVAFLAQTHLLDVAGDRVILSKRGTAVASGIVDSWRAYCLELLDMGWVQAAAEEAVGYISRDPDGHVTFDRAPLARISPQLAALLSWLAEDRDRPTTLHSDVAERLLVSTHLGEEQPAQQPPWVQRAANIGLRAELYTVHLERSRKPPGQVLHVAAESDRYGYDVEDRTVDPPMLIEVKGTSSLEHVQFFMSRKERQTATDFHNRYVVHFWGNIDLQRPMREEYSVLRAAGYPVVIADIARAIDEGTVCADPSEWQVTVPPLA